MTNVKTKTSAAGYDNISPCFIKIAANELTWPITNVISHCIVNNHYLDLYKRAETSPLYKAKDRYCNDIYRPASWLTTISKMAEYELCNQTNDHFIRLFDDKLSAFRKDIGCEQVLVNVIEQWKLALDNDKIVVQY